MAKVPAAEQGGALPLPGPDPFVRAEPSELRPRSQIRASVPRKARIGSGLTRSRLHWQIRRSAWMC
eukprot:13183705-Alexandrium_andersonii.AAC.1